MNSTLNVQRRVTSPAVADIMLVRPMQHYAIAAFVALTAAAFMGCTVSPATTDNVVRLPDGRPVAMLIQPSTQAQSANLPRVLGDVRAVSPADIRAAIAANGYPGPIHFIRVKDRNTIQLHHETLGDRCEHYDDMRRKRGGWTCRAIVVVVEGCGYVPML
jgi:hypothetical protein